jgi:hypothetical protein
MNFNDKIPMFSNSILLRLNQKWFYFLTFLDFVNPTFDCSSRGFRLYLIEKTLDLFVNKDVVTAYDTPEACSKSVNSTPELNQKPL